MTDHPRSMMTCRVRAVSTRNISFDVPRPYSQGAIYTMRVPQARASACRAAVTASANSPDAVFFVETRSDNNEWINKDIWYRGVQYEIVGDRIPGFPAPNLVPFIIGA